MKISQYLPALIIVIIFAPSSWARIWKTADRQSFSGDYVNVVGDDVHFKTNTGTKKIPYAALARADKAIIRSKLTAAGRQTEIERLDSLPVPNKTNPAPASTSTASTSSSGRSTPPSTQQLNGSGRTWTDIGGRQLQGEYVSANGLMVTLRVNGSLQNFPISGFSVQDQTWIRSQMAATPNGNSPNGTQTTPGSSFGGSQVPGNMNSSLPGFPNPAGAGMSSGHGGGASSPNSAGPSGGHGSSFSGGSSASRMQSGLPNTQSFSPGSPSLTGGTGMASGPGAGHGAGSSTGGNFSGSQFGGNTGMSSQPGGGPGYGDPGFGGTGMSDPGFNEPDFSFPEPPEPPDISIPDISGPTIEWVYVCDYCGAEFSESDGIKEGDPCPSCNGGGGSGGSFSFRGALKAIIAVVALAVSGIGFVIRKLASSN